MTDQRMVAMTAEQAIEIELYVETLMRAGYTERAAAMMNLALAWRFSEPIEPPLPDNVVEFAGYSKRVPCA